MAGDELARRGWHLTSEGQEQCLENGNKSADSIVKNALNLDLRDIGEKWLPVDGGSGKVKVDYVEGPAVLQVVKLRNISAPKDNEESQAAPRLWRLTLTDGHGNMVAICLEPLRNLSLLTPPGTKLLLEGTVDVENSYLLLTNKNARLLGGRVASLVDSWELKRKLAQQSRSGIQSQGGPPPFVPFGKKISSMEAPPRRDNFKSLAATKQPKEEEDSEFQQQRQATIAEALTAKTKTFGGGQKQFVNDRDLARIVDMGFSPDQASSALRQSGGNVNDAITGLLSGSRDRDGHGFSRGGGRGGRGGGPRSRGDPYGEEEREDSRRGGRGGRGGRRGRGERGGEEEDPVSSRPSGPATLFDFLETKIPSKSETQQTGSNQRPSSSSGPHQKHMANQASSNRPHTSSSDSYSSRGPASYNSGPQQSQSQPGSVSNHRTGNSSYRDNSNLSRSSDSNYHSQSSDSGYRSSDHGGGGRDSRGGGGGHHSDDFSHGRRQQNLPPRLANKMGRDGGNPPTTSLSQSTGSRSHENQDNRTRYGGGEPNHPGANQNGRRALQEQPYPDNRASQYAGGRGDKALLPTSHQPDYSGGNPRVQGQKARYDQHRPPQHQQGHRPNGPPRPMWHRGQTVLAKYWEDDQLYRAVVEAVAENGATAVVTFLDYGNQEEVMCSDIHPLPPQQNWNSSYPPPPPPQGAPMMPAPGFFHGYGPPGMAAPPPFPGQEGFGSGPIPNMEFRRGGSGPGHRRQEQPDRRRPTQNFYTPPPRKKEG